MKRYRPAICAAVGGILLLALHSAGCREKWDTTQNPVRDEELESAFFSGLNSIDIPELAEPTRLRPCCIFGNDVSVSVGSIPVPGYEVRNVLDVEDLGTHTYNNGTLSLQRPEQGPGVVTDEASGILYTCRGGFIDIAHVRDNADRTFYLAARIGRLAATGGMVPVAREGAERRLVVHPVDASLVRAYGIREVVIGLAEWIDFQLSIWHEIATWYRWSATAFPEQASAFSPEDLYSNLLGAKIAGQVVRRHGAASEEDYNRNVTAILRDALTKLGAMPADASRFAFRYLDGIWWDSDKRAPDNLLVTHRNFHIRPTLYPWKLVDALPSDELLAAAREYEQTCGGDWTPLGLNVPERLGGVPFRRMATIEIRPGEELVRNGFRLPKAGKGVVTQDDFPAIIQAIQRACEKELGAGACLPGARPDESSRLRG
ncbi:MAG: DUF4056 domain-containing protein [bacterium]